MGYAKKTYLELVEDLYNIVYSDELNNYYEEKWNIKGFIYNLFLTQESDKNDWDSLRNINNKERFFKKEYIINFIYNYMHGDDGMCSLFPVISGENDEYDEYYEEYSQTLSEKLFEYYKKVDPYPWMTRYIESLPKNEDNYEKISFNCLLQLLCYVCFNVSRISPKEDTNVFMKDQSQLLTKYVEEQKFVLINGFAHSGRSSLLKSFAQMNSKKSFCLDLSSCRANKIDVFSKIIESRSDIKILLNIKYEYISKFENEYEDISKLDDLIFPLFKDVSNIDEELLNQLFSEADILVIDNICDEKILSILKIIHCRKICVLKKYLNKSDDGIYVYEYNNKKLCYQILMNELVDINEAFFDVLYDDLGSDLFLYRLLLLNYKKYISVKSGQVDFIRKYIECSKYDMYELCAKYGREKITINYKGDSSGKYIDDWINSIYSNYFSKKELVLLRILFLIQNKITNLELVLKYFIADELMGKLVDFGWYIQNKLRIPKLVVVSCNRINNYYNIQYKYILEIITDFIRILDGLSSQPVNKEVCSCLIIAIHEDIIGYTVRYINPKKVTNLNKSYYKKIISKNSRKRHDAEELRKFSIKEGETTNKKSLYEIQFHASNIFRSFYEFALWFTYMYSDMQTWKKLYSYFGVYMDDETIKVYTSIWERSIIKNNAIVDNTSINLIKNMYKGINYFTYNRSVYYLLWNYYKSLSLKCIIGYCNDCLNNNCDIAKYKINLAFLVNNVKNMKSISDGFILENKNDVFMLQDYISDMYMCAQKLLCNEGSITAFYNIRYRFFSDDNKRYLVKTKSEYLVLLCAFLLKYQDKISYDLLMCLRKELLVISMECGEVPQNMLVNLTKKYLFSKEGEA